MFQVKKTRTKLQKKRLNVMETSNLPDKEFKTLVVKLHNELGSIDELCENFNKGKKEPIRTKEYND